VKTPTLGIVCLRELEIRNFRPEDYFEIAAEKGVRAIGAALGPFQFDRVYSHFFDLVLPSGAKQILQASIERYVAAIGGVYDGA
jgi:DNA topoisomerase IA